MSQESNKEEDFFKKIFAYAEACIKAKDSPEEAKKALEIAETIDPKLLVEYLNKISNKFSDMNHQEKNDNLSALSAHYANMAKEIEYYMTLSNSDKEEMDKAVSKEISDKNMEINMNLEGLNEIKEYMRQNF